MSKALSLPPLSLYIHIPWCEKKCPYCDFNSHEKKNTFNEKHYIHCLLEDLKRDLHKAQGRVLQSIFIGGGTPSLFKVDSIQKLLSSIVKEMDYSNDIEITIEANPASSQHNYFSELADTSVNRVSLGVQSFQNEKLLHLGRLHSSDEAYKALSDLKNSFTNFNIDLMFGLADQSLDDSLFDLAMALSFSPKHLSWYQLTIEPNTIFYRNTPILPNNDYIFDMQQHGQQLLADNGMHQYEISAYAKEEKYSQHNLNYWKFGDYMAIGAGAHGKITYLKEEKLCVERFQKKRMPEDYMKSLSSSFYAKELTIKPEDLPLEYFMNYLRLNEVSDWQIFEQRTGLKKTAVTSVLQQAKDLKLIEIHETYIKKTKLGNQHLDSLLGLF